MLKALTTVFKKPSYIVLAILVAAIFILLAIWLPNASLIKFVFSSESFPLWKKVNFLYSSLGYLGTNFTWLTRWMTIIIAVVSGINIAMAVFYIRRKITNDKAAGVGLLGMIMGIIGVGCASCGSVVLSSIIGLSASTSFIGFLPFNGTEFGIVALIILLISIYLVSKKIINPLTCKVN